jgi:purine-binding chemotaxis protein CheW
LPASVSPCRCRGCRRSFRFERVTPIPFAPPAIFGLANLRGKIVTAVSLRARLGLSPWRAASPVATPFASSAGPRVSVCRSTRSAMCCACPAESRLPTPAHVDSARSALTICIYPLAEGILPVLDADAILKFERN